LVGVEVAVHTDCVFVDGRIAGGSQPIDIEKIVGDVYRVAGYGDSWKPEPGKIRVTTDVCQEKLSAEESDIRPFSDDQNIVIGGWAPGGDAPFLIESWTSQGGVNLQVPRDELPADDRLTIKSIVRDLELAERDWNADLLAGYFCQSEAPWER
jgi:hypothetical protein